MTDPQDLTRRVLDAVPAGSYAMQALLSLARIEVSADVPTAAVTCERRPALLVNPDFVAAHCRTDEHLFMLVMHELYHVLLGHTRLYPVMTPAHNLAFDAVINAMLVARFPAVAYTSFFTELYAKESAALRLLAPPGEPPIEEPALAALHAALYSHRQVTAREVFDRISRDAACQAPDLSRLLGNHGRPGEPQSPIDTEFAEAVRSIAGDWPAEPGTRGLGGALAKRRVAPETPGQRVLAAVRRALLGAASLPGGPRRTHSPLLVATPVPDLRDRRASVSRALGRWPLLNAGSVSVRRPGLGRAEVYFDVSGSVNDVAAALVWGAAGTPRAYRAARAPVLDRGAHRQPRRSHRRRSNDDGWEQPHLCAGAHHPAKAAEGAADHRRARGPGT